MRNLFHATHALSEIIMANSSLEKLPYNEVLRKLCFEVRKILHKIKKIKFF